jgi:hypothetical protein
LGAGYVTPALPRHKRDSGFVNHDDLKNKIKANHIAIDHHLTGVLKINGYAVADH